MARGNVAVGSPGTWAFRWLGIGAALAHVGCGQASHQGGASGGAAPSGGQAGASLGGVSSQGGSSSLGGARNSVGGAGIGGELAAGAAGAENGSVYAAELRPAVDKVDLLLMIDNSISMADKQGVLVDAVGAVVNRLVLPTCVVDGKPTGASADANGVCPVGAPEFPPLRDIHIGVVSSSLGAHGGQTCADASGDDRGQLVPIVRPSPEVSTWNLSGFLYWDPTAHGHPPGESNLQRFQDNFRNMVLSVGQLGCGFESSLEGWYRFLIDPQPIISTPEVRDGGAVRPVYNDAATNMVLRQRAAFLRPDSAVAVVMLSDENDCSIVDEGQGFLVGLQTLNNQSFHMPRATSACARNPNDPCCASCAAATVPAGCVRPADDTVCQAGMYFPATDDALNLRCYRQKERFGFDLLYPTDRYVKGLSQYLITDRDGKLVANPLFANPNGPPRDRSLVHLVGIVGVPWQDVAVDPNAPALVYRSYRDIDWDLILGSPGDARTPPTPPRDPLMYETVLDRTTLFGTAPHPVIGAAGALAPATSLGRPNAINGHETDIRRNDDLQYACIFQLPTPRMSCTGAGCDCDQDGQDYNRAVCEQSTQTHGKAYPGVRELEVLRDFGAASSGNSVVASICPKTLSASKTDPNYGYNPVVGALVSQLKQDVGPRCLPRQLTVDDSGRVPCAVVESSPVLAGQTCAECDASSGRSAPSASTRRAVINQLRTSGRCDAAGLPACESLCLCALAQYDGNELTACQATPIPPTALAPGFCYIDPEQTTDAELRTLERQFVASCPATQQRLIRFLGLDTPRAGASITIACEAQAQP